MLLLVEEFESLIGSRCSRLNPVFPRQLFPDHPLISLFAEIDHPLISVFFAFFCTFTTFTPIHKKVLCQKFKPHGTKNQNPKGSLGSAFTFYENGIHTLIFPGLKFMIIQKTQVFSFFFKNINLFPN